MAITAQLESWFNEAAQLYHLPVGLLRAVADVETGGSFKTNLTSRAGAQGLMQLMPETAETLGVADPFDPHEAILGAAKYLRHLLSTFGAWEPVIAAYNAGRGYVEGHDSPDSWSSGIRTYVRKVMDSWMPGSVPAFDKGITTHTLPAQVITVPYEVVSAPYAAPTVHPGVVAGIAAIFIGIGIALANRE